MSNLTIDDIPLLRSYGFEAGFSGTSWFGKDRSGVEYQAVETDVNERLVFYKVVGREPADISREDLHSNFIQQ